MRIIIYYEQRDYGGVDTFLSHLINFWPEEKDEFIIVTNNDNRGIDYLLSSIKNPKITIYRMSPNKWYAPSDRSKFVKSVFIARAYSLFFFKFTRYLSKANPDIILVSNGSYPGGLSTFIAIIIAKFFKAPSFLMVHHAILFKSYIPSVVVANFLSVIINLFKIKRLTVSLASKKMLEKFTPLKNFKVIYNGLSISTKNESINLQSKLGVQNKTLIGTIGRLDDFKGHETILHAFNESEFLRENAHYVIVGSGNPVVINKLLYLVSNYNIEKNITFTGFIKGDPIDVVKSFDILAMPTKDFEGFGYSYAEAMLSKIPVIASNVGAISEIIEDQTSGLIIEPMNIKEWVIGLEFLIRNPKKRRTFGINAQQRIVNSFSAEKMALNYHNMFLENIYSKSHKHDEPSK